MRRQNASRVLWAAIAALPLVALPAISSGQTVNQVGTQPNNTGRANDASNQVGSGGINGNGNVNPNATGNQIINGEVTNGRSFQGNAPNSDMARFQGNVPAGETQTANFYRDSTGVPGYGQRTVAPNQSVPFYPDTRAVPPPAGYGQTAPGQIGYVPVVPMVSNSTALYHAGTSADAVSPTLPQTTNLLLPAGVDASGNPTVISASALYGVRALNINDATDQMYLKTLLQQGSVPSGVDAATVQRVRDEMAQAAQQQANAEAAGIANPNGSAPETSPQAPGVSPQLGQSLTAPSNPAITNPVPSGEVTGTEISHSVQTPSANQLVPPEMQSSQYLELLDRLKAFQSPRPRTAAEIQADLNNAIARKNAAGVQPPGPATNPSQGGAAAPGAVTPAATGSDLNSLLKQAAESGNKPEPLEIKSLAAGVHAKGLADFLTKAEDLMKDGKYNSAIDQYEAAQTVAPNNPLIAIGRANAELGAGLFAQADRHLREALGKDQSLLMARYDLRTFIGEKRLGEIVKQLKDASASDPTPQPMFLLAYVAYNTGMANRAQGYLTLADKRAGGKDPLYQIIREHWKLPPAEPASSEPQLNK